MLHVWLLFGLLSLALIALAIYSYRLQKRLVIVEQQHQRHTEKMRQEMTALNSAAIGVGQRLISAEKKLKKAVEQSEVQSFNTTGIDASVQAAYSTDANITAQELTDRYGLSEAEANLMVLLKMHGDEKVDAV